jgi:Rod binding domain-containing protein
LDPSEIATLAGSLDVERAQQLARGIDRNARRDAADLRDAATEFEAYFLKVFLAEARKTVTSGGLFGGDDNLFSSSGAEGYQALLDDALARHAARAGGIGLGDQLLAQWEKSK